MRRSLAPKYWLVLLICQAAVAIAINRPWISGDSPVYLQLAQSLGQGAYGINGPDALRPPGYPIILWLLAILPTWALVALQLGVVIGCLWIVDLFLRRQNFSPLPFRFIALIYPFPALYAGWVMSEAWAMLGLTLLATLLCRDDYRPVHLIAAGAICGIISLIRADMLLLPLVVLAIAWVRKRSALSILLPLVAALLVVSPYIAFNWAHFDKPSPAPIASAVGNSLYLATWQTKLPLEDIISLYGEPSERARSSGLVAEAAAINRSFGAPPDTVPFNPANYPSPRLQIASAQRFGDVAMQEIAREPAPYLVHIVSNVWRLWNSTNYPGPAMLGAAMIFLSSLVWALGLLGAVMNLRTRLWPAVLVMAYPMIVHLPLHIEARYTAAARPLLMMFAALAVGALGVRALSKVRRRRSRTGP